ncbi:MAG TPA: hypothetical protein VGK21_12500, partial [Candidatus Angelobacter sp.]
SLALGAVLSSTFLFLELKTLSQEFAQRIALLEFPGYLIAIFTVGVNGQPTAFYSVIAIGNAMAYTAASFYIMRFIARRRPPIR